MNKEESEALNASPVFQPTSIFLLRLRPVWAHPNSVDKQENTSVADD